MEIHVITARAVHHVLTVINGRPVIVPPPARPPATPHKPAP